jgi:hypothetical protein
MCLKNDGQHCASASTGKQICWRPGETGEKASGDTLQVRNAGGSPTPPQTPPPPGASFTQGGSATGSTTSGGVSFTTSITNYGTGGVSASTGGTPDTGEPDDGSGSPPSSDSEDDGSVSGGANCDDPPVVSGDPVLASIVWQTWGTKCAIESGDAVTSTGDIGDCNSAWTISGPPGDANVEKLKAARAQVCGNTVTSTGEIGVCSEPWTISGPVGDANVEKLKALRAQICSNYADSDGDGQPDWTQGDAPTPPGEGDPELGEEPGVPSDLIVGTDLLDMTGILGTTASAPSLGVIDFGSLGSFDMDSEPFWADLVAIMHAIVLLVCGFTAVKILMGSN